MLYAIQAGTPDKDPAQSERILSRILEENLPSPYALAYIDQPSTPLELVPYLSPDVTKFTPDFEKYGLAALEVVMVGLAEQADRLLVFAPGGERHLMDDEVISYFAFLGKPVDVYDIEYEKVEVL